MKKEKEKNPILYEKYKRDHHLNETVSCKEKIRPPWYKKVGGLLLTLILIAMSFLSVVGALALWHPTMRMILFNLFLM